MSVRDVTCWRSASTSAAVAGVVFETVGAGDEAEMGVASCAKPAVTGKVASVTKIIFFIKTPDLETRASTPEQFKPCCVRRAMI